MAVVLKQLILLATNLRQWDITLVLIETFTQ